MKQFPYAITPRYNERIQEALRNGLSKEAFLRSLVQEDASLLRKSLVLSQLEKAFIEQEKRHAFQKLDA